MQQVNGAARQTLRPIDTILTSSMCQAPCFGCIAVYLPIGQDLSRSDLKIPIFLPASLHCRHNVHRFLEAGSSMELGVLGNTLER